MSHSALEFDREATRELPARFRARISRKGLRTRGERVGGGLSSVELSRRELSRALDWDALQVPLAYTFRNSIPPRGGTSGSNNSGIETPAVLQSILDYKRT